MPLCESLTLSGVSKYKSTRDVPYIRDQDSPEFSGAFGVVYRATKGQQRAFRPNIESFAVRTIRISPQNALAVELEIKFLRQCKHPNILELEEAYCVEQGEPLLLDTIFLVTKPWAPVSLQNFIINLIDNQGDHSTYCSWYQPYKLEPWPMIIKQCLQGLEYLHKATPYPIRHKDLKPDNILLLDETKYHSQPLVRPIITDLVISKEFIIGLATSNDGTYSYLAPEQVGNSDPTPKSDVFSLGCCFTYIEGILHSGRDGLLKVYESTLETKSCRFADNASRVNEFLNNPIGPSTLTSDAGLNVFRKGFRQQVTWMLESNLDYRPDITQCVESYSRLESQLE